MQTDDRLLPRLTKCIRTHGVKAANFSNAAIESFAGHILISQEQAFRASGVKEDEEVLSALISASRAIQRLLAELSPANAMQLDYALTSLRNSPKNAHANQAYELTKLFEPRDTANLGRIKQQVDIQAAFEAALRSLVTHNGKRNKASVQRNYEAAIVAKACRKVWMEVGPNGKAPKSLNADRHGPFGDFLAEAFDILRIESEPSSAMYSLSQLGELKPLSVTYG